MEEMNVMTIEETENNTEVKDYYEDLEEDSSEAKSKVFVVIAGVVVAGVAAALHFTKDKRRAWREQRLEKQGFVKLKPGEYIARVEDDDSEEVEDAE